MNYMPKMKKKKNI